MSDAFLRDDEWDDLLHAIHGGQVIPVIGPELVTIVDQATNRSMPLHQALAPELAKALGLGLPERYTSWDDVARDYLLSGGKRQRIYYRLADLLDNIDHDPSPALQAIAGISDFGLYLCSTPDPLLSRAMEIRDGFHSDTHVGRFHPSNPGDLSRSPQGPQVYHFLGDYRTQPDFAVWEEDFIEFICGPLERAPMMKELFSRLKNDHLLLLGAPSKDWAVRFLLRVARQRRLSSREGDNHIYLADYIDNLGDSMVMFFDRALKATRVIDGSPSTFSEELARRWHGKYGAKREKGDILKRMPGQMTKNAVFISYSRDDIGKVIPFAQSLHDAGIPVWLDKSRIDLGDNFERSLEHAVKHDCSYFVSIISAATESDGNRFVHQEREWASTRHVDGYAFYLPIMLDLPEAHVPKMEPARVRHVHRVVLDATSLPSIKYRLRHWVDEFRRGNRPRN